MNNQNFNRLIRSDEKYNHTNSHKKLISSGTKMSNFKQINFKPKNFEEDEKKNLNELSAKNNIFQNHQKTPSFFKM
jgi:hypothetical protein